MEEKIIEIMERVFGINGLTADTSQADCAQWDSLRHLNLVIELEDEFDTDFEPEEISEMKSVKAIMEILANRI